MISYIFTYEIILITKEIEDNINNKQININREKDRIDVYTCENFILHWAH